MKDIVGTWAKVARENGLKFGVSNHSSHAWHWFQVAYYHDIQGSLKGVPYDAATLTKADGKGTWWEGLDPKDLYCGLRIPMDKDPATLGDLQSWHWNHDTHWFEQIPPFDNGYSAKWFLRTQDLVDKYHPDLMYFDDEELPLGEYGLAIAAHYYNSSAAANNGNVEVVLDAKKMTPEHAHALVPDIERGVSEGIRPQPWQTDTCIGSWHYDRRIYNDHHYKTTGQVVRMLVDIVSKNGNLLLSVPVRGNGELDSDEEKFLHEMGAWMDINSEAIYGTRPWVVYGEGPSTTEQVKKGEFGGAEDVRSKPYTAEDIRFTKKDRTIYAFLLAWPQNGSAQVKSLAANAAGLHGASIASVKLLGSDAKLTWNQDAGGLHVTLPAKAPCDHAYTLKIETK
jgi:alpha-L-fucosidase